MANKVFVNKGFYKRSRTILHGFDFPTKKIYGNIFNDFIRVLRNGSRFYTLKLKHVNSSDVLTKYKKFSCLIDLFYLQYNIT